MVMFKKILPLDSFVDVTKESTSTSSNPKNNTSNSAGTNNSTESGGNEE